jgi:aminopeptidase N
MSGREREGICRRCADADEGGTGGPAPFVLGGARPHYAPDRTCDVQHMKIEVRLDFERAEVRGKCTHSVSPINGGPTRLTLDAVEMEIEAVLAAGAATPWSYDGHKLVADLGTRRAGEKLDLEVRYRCRPRRGLYFLRPDEDYPNRPTQAWSQGQDEDNRCWFPCVDHPNEKSTSEVIATVPAKMTVLSNGRPQGAVDHGDGTRTFHFKHDVPHSSYLVTLVAGEYVDLVEKVGDVELHVLVPPGREGDAPRSFARTGEMIRLFGERIGHPYPYPRYSQVVVADFIFGGMENTSATTLTDDTLHDERAHLDFSSESLVAHELAHQWFGDLITCRDWSEGWLNEGFATYFEILWREHSDGVDWADYDRLLDQEAYLDEDARRYRRPVVANVYHEPIDVFDRHLYEKGGAVLHMLRNQLGDERFWRAIGHYVQKHKWGSVETRDLARAVDEATGVNPDRFFEQWVFRAGYPDLKVELQWDDAHKQARVRVEQKQEAKGETPLFWLPLTIGFVVDGKAQPVTLEVERAEETFVIPLAAKPTQAVIDPRNHVLKKLDAKKPDDLWRAEVVAAPDGIDRVRAARALGEAREPGAVEALSKAMREDAFWAVRGEAALALGEIKTDGARDAIAGALPFEKHPRARRQLVRALAAFRDDARAGEAIARVLEGDASYFVEAEAASALGKVRAPGSFERVAAALERPSYLEVIRSACLGAMAELRDERGFEVALRESKRGRPPWSRRAAIAALGVLADEHQQYKRRALEALTELLDDRDFRARIAAVEALRVLADPRALGALARAEQVDLDGRVRRRSREVQKSIVEGRRPREQVSGLREQLEKLQGDTRELRERLLKLEAERAKK